MNRWKLSTLFTGLAAAGFGLRYLVYAMAVDGKNLIVSGHPFLLGLWALTAAAMGLAAYAAWKQKGTEAFADHFSASNPAFLGSGMLGVGIALTLVLNGAPMPGLLGLLWKLFGWLSPLCLLAAGWQRLRGKKPFFGLYCGPCLFFAVHAVCHYQVWCSNPQFTDYAFALLGTMALSLLLYQLAAFSADAGKKGMLTFFALAAVYLSGAELAASPYPYLYYGGILFALTALPDDKV